MGIVAGYNCCINGQLDELEIGEVGVDIKASRQKGCTPEAPVEKARAEGQRNVQRHRPPGKTTSSPIQHEVGRRHRRARTSRSLNDTRAPKWHVVYMSRLLTQSLMKSKQTVIPWNMMIVADQGQALKTRFPGTDFTDSCRLAVDENFGLWITRENGQQFGYKHRPWSAMNRLSTSRTRTGVFANDHPEKLSLRSIVWTTSALFL